MLPECDIIEVQSIHEPALSLLKIANCIEIIIKSQHQLGYC